MTPRRRLPRPADLCLALAAPAGFVGLAALLFLFHAALDVLGLRRCTAFLSGTPLPAFPGLWGPGLGMAYLASYFGAVLAAPILCAAALFLALLLRLFQEPGAEVPLLDAGAGPAERDAERRRARLEAWFLVLPALGATLLGWSFFSELHSVKDAIPAAFNAPLKQAAIPALGLLFQVFVVLAALIGSSMLAAGTFLWWRVASAFRQSLRPRPTGRVVGVLRWIGLSLGWFFYLALLLPVFQSALSLLSRVVIHALAWKEALFR